MAKDFLKHNLDLNLKIFQFSYTIDSAAKMFLIHFLFPLLNCLVYLFEITITLQCFYYFHFSAHKG